jgi:hypothetical protein
MKVRLSWESLLGQLHTGLYVPRAPSHTVLASKGEGWGEGTANLESHPSSRGRGKDYTLDGEWPGSTEDVNLAILESAIDHRRVR